MKRLLIVAALILTSSAPLRGEPVSPEEAQQKLLEKQKQRESERSQTVTMSAGELQDMKTELATLRAEVIKLRAQLATAGSTKPVIAIARKFDKIDVGMTRTEVMAFIHQHAKEFALAGVDVSQSSAPNPAVPAAPGAPAAAPKHEVLRLDHFQATRVVTGTHVSLGVTYTDSEWQYPKIGGILVTLDDDKVTGVSAR